MATTDFLPFAIAGGANVISQATFAAAASTANGYTSGIAVSGSLNKAWRQSSVIAAGVANLLVNAGINVPDDGNMSALISNLSAYFNHLSVVLIKTLTINAILTPAEIYRAPWFFVGALGSAVNVTVPNVSFERSVSNQSGQTITIKYASGLSVDVQHNETAVIAGDGTNIVEIGSGRVRVNAGLTGGTSGSPTPLIVGFNQALVNNSTNEYVLPSGVKGDRVTLKNDINPVGGYIMQAPATGTIGGSTSISVLSNYSAAVVCLAPLTWCVDYVSAGA